jgi:hypothetical protein
MATPRTPEQDPLVPQRLALIALIALIAGAIVGTLTYFASQGVHQALLAGLIAAAAAPVPLDKLIGRCEVRGSSGTGAYETFRPATG